MEKLKMLGLKFIQNHSIPGTCLFDSMKHMKNNRAPGDDGLTGNFTKLLGWIENSSCNRKY